MSDDPASADETPSSRSRRSFFRRNTSRAQGWRPPRGGGYEIPARPGGRKIDPTTLGPGAAIKAEGEPDDDVVEAIDLREPGTPSGDPIPVVRRQLADYIRAHEAAESRPRVQYAAQQDDPEPSTEEWLRQVGALSHDSAAVPGMDLDVLRGGRPPATRMEARLSDLIGASHGDARSKYEVLNWYGREEPPSRDGATLVSMPKHRLFDFVGPQTGATVTKFIRQHISVNRPTSDQIIDPLRMNALVDALGITLLTSDPNLMARYLIRTPNASYVVWLDEEAKLAFGRFHAALRSALAQDLLNPSIWQALRLLIREHKAGEPVSVVVHLLDARSRPSHITLDLGAGTISSTPSPRSAGQDED